MIPPVHASPHHHPSSHNCIGTTISLSKLVLGSSSSSGSSSSCCCCNSSIHKRNAVGSNSLFSVGRTITTTTTTTRTRTTRSKTKLPCLVKEGEEGEKKSIEEQEVIEDEEDEGNDDEEWIDDLVIPFQEGSHNSARISILAHNDDDSSSSSHLFSREVFQERLGATIDACQRLGKSSLWVHVHMSRASLIEDMLDVGLRFHHAEDEMATLNLWLRNDVSESKIPEYATHHVGVGGFVVNSRQQVLCVRELRRNYMPWKIPGGLAELGENIDEAVVREVYEETGIQTKFHSILGFRHTHGRANGRSDLFFVCRVDPIEPIDENTGQPMIPHPVPQACEIEKVAWVDMEDYKAMVATEDKRRRRRQQQIQQQQHEDTVDNHHHNNSNNNKKKDVQSVVGHPMMDLMVKFFDSGDDSSIQKSMVKSVVPGSRPSPIYHPPLPLIKTNKEKEGNNNDCEEEETK